MALIYAFMAVIYHVTLNIYTRDYIVQTIVYALTVLNALVLPSILFKNYYKQLVLTLIIYSIFYSQISFFYAFETLIFKKEFFF